MTFTTIEKKYERKEAERALQFRQRFRTAIAAQALGLNLMDHQAAVNNFKYGIVDGKKLTEILYALAE